MFEKACERREMSCEASVLVKQIAEPRVVGDSVKTAINRAAQRLRWRYSRTKDIWYGRARRIDASEMDALRAATRRTLNTTDRLLALRNALASKDEAFHRHDIDALERALERLGCDVGAAHSRRTQEADREAENL